MRMTVFSMTNVSIWSFGLVFMDKGRGVHSRVVLGRRDA